MQPRKPTNEGIVSPLATAKRVMGEAGFEPAKRREPATPAASPKDAAKWQNEISDIDAEIARLQKGLKDGSFGGGRGASAVSEQITYLRGNRQDVLNKIQSGREVRTTAGDVAREVVNAPFRGAVNTTLSGVAGIADIVGADDAAESVRGYRDSVTAKYGAPESASQNTILRYSGQVAEGVGSTAPFLVGAAGGIGKVVAGTIASGTGIDEQDSRVKGARAAGTEVSSGQEIASEALGGLVGLAELAPVSALLSKVPKGYGGRVVSAISERLAARGLGRVAGAALEEGVQEAASGVAQDLIEAGVYNDSVQIGQSALQDFALGAAVGGSIRGGVEIASGIGKRATAKGKREQIRDGDVSLLNDDDLASPIPNDAIEAGKRTMAEAEADSIESAVLQKAGMPKIGTSIAYEIPGRPPIIGTVDGSFNEMVNGERVAGIIIRTADGKVIRDHFDDIADAGAVVRPMEQGEFQAAADAIDARLAAQAATPSQFEQAAQSLQTPVLQRDQVSTPASANRFDMERYLARNAQIESGNNPNAKAKTSSASGLYQFTKATWIAQGGKWGSDPNKPFGGLKPSVDEQRARARSLTEKNAAAVKAAGAPLTDGNLYLAHFLGEGGARSLFKAAPNTPVADVLSADQINANPSILKSKTVADVMAWASRKMGGQPGDPTMAGGVALPEGQPTQYADVDFGEVRRAPVAPIAIRTEEREDVITTARDRDVRVKYGVVEARDLVASNTPDGTVNPNYPADMQPRDRTRASSQMQIQQISSKLRPYWLGRTFRPDDGAPVISPNGVVESGNGRTIAIQQVYQEGGAKADEYRRFVETQGIDTTGMEQPVLVRLRTEEMDAEAARGFAREANMATSLGMAPTEQAFADTDALPEGIMTLYQGGDVDAAANRDFVRRYMDTVMSPAEAANLRRADGSPNPRAFARIRNAMLARAYDNPRLVENLSESTDSNIVAIGGALTDIAGVWSKLRQEIAGGQIPAEYDITTNLNEAIELVERSRREGKPLVDLVNQREMFTGETTDPVTEAVLRLLFNRPDFAKPAGRKRVRERLQAYLDDATSQRLDQGSLLDEPAAPDVAGAVRAARGMEGYENAPAPEQPAAAAAEQPTDESGATGVGPSAPAGGEPDAGPGRESVPPQRGEEAGGLTPEATVKPDLTVEQVSPDAQKPENLKAPSIAGQKIDGDWTAFTDASGTLGIPRADMPQVKAEHRGALVNFLNARGIEHREVEVLPGSIIPTQAEFSPAKVKKAKDYEGGDRAILISSDGYVLDGHHQWMAALESAPKEDIRTIQLMAPIKRLLEVVPEMPSATTAEGATKSVTPAPDTAQPDMLGGPTADERRQALERRGDAPMRGRGDQRPAGSDGGLFDTAAPQQTDLLDEAAPVTEPAPEADVANIAEQIPDAEREARNRRLLDQAVPANEAQGFRITSSNSPGVVRLVMTPELARREALSIAQSQGQFDQQFDAIMAYTGGSATFGPVSIEYGPLENLTGVTPAGQQATTAPEEGAQQPEDAPEAETQPDGQQQPPARRSRARRQSGGAQPIEDGEILPTDPLVELDGDEIGAPDGAEIEEVRSAAQKWYRANLLSKSAKSANGWNVAFNLRGMKKTLRGGEFLLRAVPAIRQIIENGSLVETRPGDQTGTKAMHLFASDVSINGEVRRVGVFVRETPEGRFQYSLNQMERKGPAKAGRDNANASITPASEGALADLNLFLLDENSNAAPSAPAEPANDAGIDSAKVEQFHADLAQQLQSLGLSDKVTLSVVERIAANPKAAGSYQDGLIRIALASTQDPAFTLNHEAIHALRALGLFTDMEWATLSRRARDDAALMASIKRRYPDLDAEAQVEEAVADMYARWAAQRLEGKGFVRSAFERLRSFMEAVRNALRGMGMRSADSIMRAVERGDVGRRQDNSAFQRWFNGSKIVDNDGNPQVVYHGSGADITVFQSQGEQKPYGNRGIYFTPDPGYAAAYAENELFGRNNDVQAIYPVYLSVKNPLIINAPKEKTRKEALVEMFDKGRAKEMRRERMRGLLPERRKSMFITDADLEQYRRDGYDGIVNYAANEIVVFDARQVKSATGNTGAFDPENVDIRFSVPDDGTMERQRGPFDLFGGREGAVTDMVDALRAKGPLGGPLGEKAQKAYEKWRTGLQDRFLPLLKLQSAIEQDLGKKLDETANPYLGEELMTGRIGAKLDRLTDEVVEPLFEAMAAEGVALDELESYLYARHAPERNARIAEINPAFQPGEGSGMTDTQAAAIMARIERDGKKDAMERLAARIDTMLADALALRVEAGLMSEADAKAWREHYKHYVPLRGKAEVEGADDVPSPRPLQSSGISVKGKESRMAYGRRSKADSILAYAIMQAEEAIVRAEKNMVARKFYELAKMAPDPAFWQVDKVERRPVFNKAKGQVEYQSQTRISAEDAPYTVSVKIEGVEHRVTMNRDNAEAVKLATAMRNLNANQMGWLVQMFGKLNRYLSFVNTSLNPEFLITNAFRDFQAAGITLNKFEMDGLVGKVLGDYRKALVASVKGEFGKGSGEWETWRQEFVDNGGRVYFNQIEDLDSIKRRIERSLQKVGDNAMGRLSVKRTFNDVLAFIENANSGVENAIRLSAYKNARETGMTKTQAASLAKNLTVNFNRRGEWGAAINAGYLFFNASVQGSAVIIGASKSKRVQKILAGIVIAGAAVEIMNAMISDDDEDGQSYYDKISDFDKSRNLILMLPGGNGKHLKIPMSYGYNSFFGLGRGGAEIARRGGEGWKGSAITMLTTVIDAFNPIGSGSLLSLISPTVTDPLIDLFASNRDFADRPIMPDQNPFGPPEPDAQRYFGSVAPHWKAVTDFLTTATGGDDVVAGEIDVSPETLEYMQGFVLGAAGGFADRLIGLGGKLVGEDPTVEISANDFPFYRKVVGDAPPWFARSAFYERVQEVELRISDAKKYAEREDIERLDKYVAKHLAVVSMEDATKAAQKDMRAINKAKGANQLAYDLGKIDKQTYNSERAVYKQAEDIVIQEYNTIWVATVIKKEQAATQ